ncbi:MAG: archaeosortase A [Methanoregula sp.]|nr:archaeosortase A [Methanoregula sp.]
MYAEESPTIMSDLLVLCAFLSFAVFLLVRQQRYAATAGWACMVFNLWSEMPAFLREDNFLYPALAVLSLPFLAITAERLQKKDPVVLQLSRTAAIATLIYVPFALVPVLHDGLISIVVTLAFGLITALGHHPQMVAWDVMAEHAFANQIILGCTGIMAVAMMLGVVFGEKDLTLRQALLSFLLVVPAIFLLNLLRVAVVFIAVSDRWFAGFPDPTGTGSADFFWAHNVIAETLAVLFLLVLLRALARIIPRLGIFFRALWNVYFGRLRGLVAPAQDTL